MTPDEAATLRGIGHNVLSGFVAIVNETILLTVYAVLVIKSSFVLLCKERRREKVSLLTMAAILIMFAISLVLWALDIANYITEATVTLIQDPDDPIDTKLDRALEFVFRLAAAEDALYAYMSILGDAIIIWRAYVLTTPDRKWVVIVPCAVLVGSAVATLMLTFCVARVGSEIVLGTFQKPAFCRNVQTATYSMAAATTTIATALIGVTTWHYRRAIKPMLSISTNTDSSKRRNRSQAERVLLLLVESGVLYFIFFAIQLIGDIPPIHDWIATQSGLAFTFVMYSYSASVIVGIYPTIIVVLAHSKHGVLDQAVTSASTFRVVPVRLAASTSVTVDTMVFGQNSQTGTSTRWPEEIELHPELHSPPDVDQDGSSRKLPASMKSF